MREKTALYPCGLRNSKQQQTIIDVGERVRIGDTWVPVIAGPCSIESEDQIVGIAKALKQLGIRILRGGAFKPRTSPYEFQGLGKEGLIYLKQASIITGLKTLTEVLDPRDVELVASYSDILQIGSRSMQNFPLLREVGGVDKPVVLKRGFNATYKEFLLAAEYILSAGNKRVILCERGIRTSFSEMRFTLDLSIVPYLKQRTHLPIIVDPSHGTGNSRLVIDMSKAAIACGADGLLIEVHFRPKESFTDANQVISISHLKKSLPGIDKVARAIGRNIFS